MRVTTFLLYFCFLLLGGKNYATTVIVKDNLCFTNSQNIFENTHTIVSGEDQNITVIDDLDLDTEEEFSADTSLKNSNTLFAQQNSLVTTLYSANLTFSLSNYYKKSFKTFPHLSGTSCPIYIIQRVIRI